MLEIININKKYGQKKVLHDVTFSVASGTVCGLLGLNGAGKSTLMKIVTSLAFKDSGEIKYNGNVYNKDDNTVPLGYMIESPAFYKDLSGRNNLKILSALYDTVKEDRVDQVLCEVGLDDVKNSLVSNYSLGMKQRLYFAYSILNNPEILILDEPFNGIDPVTSRLFKDLILNLAKQGCTIIVSSHVISDIHEICDKVVIIDKGNVVYDSNLNESENLEKLFLSKVTTDGLAQ
ncbi:ABC transporter ATP-binding protein [Peloplasma aerotolerans]|uniref:ABC transporter ATP-binding protein n=1 Tax=Peloplasma aerotolerans TaxID=3044389 RepID=A0AAW6U6X5_9MOLU|nr:ABC transporter ATP-binding protein [Mariniplasma sp. M4Ah]MDI6453713.1 ABC transporter ATP-binding protein [Mariniplasma sp. M4Ah]